MPVQSPAFTLHHHKVMSVHWLEDKRGMQLTFPEKELPHNDTSSLKQDVIRSPKYTKHILYSWLYGEDSWIRQGTSPQGAYIPAGRRKARKVTSLKVERDKCHKRERWVISCLDRKDQKAKGNILWKTRRYPGLGQALETQWQTWPRCWHFGGIVLPMHN